MQLTNVEKKPGGFTWSGELRREGRLVGTLSAKTTDSLHVLTVTFTDGTTETKKGGHGIVYSMEQALQWATALTKTHPTIISGGQTGSDRAALDFAQNYGFNYSGFCPKDGWAEDMPYGHGLLELYPELKATPSAHPDVRTILNVTTSSATMVFSTGDNPSPGTELTLETAAWDNKPLLVVGPETSPSEAYEFVTRHHVKALNVAGPRESESPGIYDFTYNFLTAAFL